MIEVAVIGAGAMGRLHARTIASHPGARLVEVVDPDPSSARVLADAFGAVASAPGPLHTDARLAIVATPTRTHVDVALPLLAERWVLVEKPMGPSVAAAQALVHPRCLVGQSERFHPALRGRRPPRHVELMRESPRSARGRDTDVVFDLMLHDLDLVRCWAQGEVEVDDAGGRIVRGEDLDVAWASLVWAGGHARLDASRVAARRWRRAWLDREVIDLLAPVDGDDTLTAQLDATLRHIATGAGGTTSADALESLRLAELVRHRAMRRAMDAMDEAPDGWAT